jgi:hypothetical protein
MTATTTPAQAASIKTLVGLAPSTDGSPWPRQQRAPHWWRRSSSASSRVSHASISLTRKHSSRPTPEATRTPALAAQVVDRLGAHLQPGAELCLHDRQVCEELRDGRELPR